MRSRRNIASATALAVLAGVPIGIAVLHQGFPVTDPDLRAREVWVTNAEDLLAGRLNRQIEELDAAVATATNEMIARRPGVTCAPDTEPLTVRAGSPAPTGNAHPCRS